MVELKLPKLMTRVRFPSPAPRRCASSARASESPRTGSASRGIPSTLHVQIVENRRLHRFAVVGSSVCSSKNCWMCISLIWLSGAALQVAKGVAARSVGSDGLSTASSRWMRRRNRYEKGSGQLRWASNVAEAKVNLVYSLLPTTSRGSPWKPRNQFANARRNHYQLGMD